MNIGDVLDLALVSIVKKRIGVTEACTFSTVENKVRVRMIPL